jgi:hypothetical protein
MMPATNPMMITQRMCMASLARNSQTMSSLGNVGTKAVVNARFPGRFPPKAPVDELSI